MTVETLTQFNQIEISSNLLNISWTTDSPFLDVNIYTIEHSKNIFSVRLYAVNGIVTLYDLRSVVETYLLGNNLAFDAFEIQTETSDAYTITDFVDILYSSHLFKFDYTKFINNFFLTSLPSKRTYPKSVEFLSFLHQTGKCDLKANVFFRTINGVRTSEEFILKSFDFTSSGVETVCIKYAEILDRLDAMNLSPDRLLSYTLTLGGKHFTFYVHDFTPNVIFTFRNNFNCWEVAALNGVTAKETQSDSSETVCNSLLQLYDRTHIQTRKFESAPLSDEESGWIEQLVISPVVKYGVSELPNNLSNVILSGNSETNDDNSAVNTVKFEYRFADRRPHFNHVYNGQSGIFTEQFGPEFT